MILKQLALVLQKKYSHTVTFQYRVADRRSLDEHIDVKYIGRWILAIYEHRLSNDIGFIHIASSHPEFLDEIDKSIAGSIQRLEDKC